MAKKQRSDTDRRLRQCERLGRVLRTLQLITGGGRWDAEALASELECSRRTIHRILQTLSVAGVPWYFDPETKAYRVRPGYRFSPLGKDVAAADAATQDNATPGLSPLLEEVLRDGERFQATLAAFLDALRASGR